MKRIPILIQLLIIGFFALSCSVSHLRYEVSIEDEVAQLIRSVPSAESYPDAAVIYILDECIVEVSGDGKSKKTFHKVFKILKDRGKDSANIEIGYNSRTETASLIYAKTITPERKTILLNENAIQVITPYSEYPSYSDYRELTFTLPGVTVGAIVDYKVVIEEKEPAIKGKFSSDFYFQTSEPIYLSRYKIITHRNMDLNYRVLNPLQGIEISPKIVSDGDNKTYFWEYRHLPQIITETSMPPMEEVAFRILVTTMNSWEEFSRWWRKLIAGKAEPDDSIRRKVEDLTKDLSTPKEKIEAVFDYVKREIRYVSIGLGKSGYEPEAATKVFENKYGDCKDKSTLLISMLRTAGIPAHYVLIPTSSMGNVIKDFPYPFQFNHCIVSVKNGGNHRFLDPVAETYRFDYLPGFDRNRGVLIFDDERIVFDKTPLAKPEENAYYTQSQIKIGFDGSIECEVKTFGVGGQEALPRSFFIKNGPTKIKESLEKRVNEIFLGGKLLTYAHSDPLNFKERFELKIKYEAQGYSKQAGNLLIFQVPEILDSCPVTGKQARRYPIVIQNNSYSKDEVGFEVPEGYDVYYLPEPTEINNQYFEFRSNYRQEGGKVFYHGEFIKKAIRITPEEYPAYHESCEVMARSFRRDVLFKATNNILGNR